MARDTVLCIVVLVEQEGIPTIQLGLTRLMDLSHSSECLLRSPLSCWITLIYSIYTRTFIYFLIHFSNPYFCGVSYRVRNNIMDTLVLHIRQQVRRDLT
jgi:hypothetical protein